MLALGVALRRIPLFCLRLLSWSLAVRVSCLLIRRLRRLCSAFLRKRVEYGARDFGWAFQNSL